MKNQLLKIGAFLAISITSLFADYGYQSYSHPSVNSVRK